MITSINLKGLLGILIPMAISLGFAIVFATFIILVMVPCVYLLVEDVRGCSAERIQPKRFDGPAFRRPWKSSRNAGHAAAAAAFKAACRRIPLVPYRNHVSVIDEYTVDGVPGRLQA